MDILSTILKTVDFDIDFGDILDAIHRVSPGLSFLIAGVVGLGGMAIVVIFFMNYIQ